MNGQNASSSDARPMLKRSREAKEINDQADGEESLLALVKKRRSDVKGLVDRIDTLENELIVARKKLAAAETLLQTMQEPEKNMEKKKKKNEPPDSVSGDQNGPTEAKIGGYNHGAGGNVHKSKLTSSQNRSSGNLVSTRGHLSGTARDMAEDNELPVMSSMDTASGRAANDIRRDKKLNAHEVSVKSKMDAAGGRTPIESDRRDRKALDNTSGADKSNKVARPASQLQQREHVDLISKIKSKSKAQPVAFHLPVFTSCQHRRKMRSLVLNPSSDNQCATSALDGVINFWQIHPKALDINFRYSVECLSPGQRHWSEDLAWHPDGHSLFAVYTADNKDAQIAIIKNDHKKKSVKFLPDKPHVKGILNGITFMPWSSSQFVTGGSDHMVHMWHEKDGEDVWKPKLLHGDLHTSAVHGVAGTQHKKLVLSAGADKRVIGYDPTATRMILKHDLDSKAMTVLPNTADFNLFMVQTGQPNKQLHLFDLRTKTELHTFGWHQESSDTQSSLITQSWSPDGYYTASGSADPKIVLFDIRFNGREPAQTIYAHSKRVFMAVWHHTLPLMLSISSDLNIGVHRISGK